MRHTSSSKKHDIFLSYASLDRNRVMPLVNELENQGWSVWWDLHIPGGKTYDEYIEENLKLSKIIVVVWSRNSIQSRWVRSEATEGLKSESLVPVKIDPIEPPLAFRLVQTANLIDWKRGELSEEFDKFLRDIRALLQKPFQSQMKQEKEEKVISTPEPDYPTEEDFMKLAIGDREGKNEVFIDPRDSQTYRTLRHNGKIWMAQNLNFELGEGSWFYNNNSELSEKFGRLYNWEAAKKACPPGWHLPTDEEWKELLRDFGGYYDGNIRKNLGKPEKAYEALILGGYSTFGALLGGWRYSHDNFGTLGSNGYYWSSTEKDASAAWHYYFMREYRRAGRASSPKARGCSCRCIKD